MRRIVSDDNWEEPLVRGLRDLRESRRLDGLMEISVKEVAKGVLPNFFSTSSEMWKAAEDAETRADSGGSSQTLLSWSDAPDTDAVDGLGLHHRRHSEALTTHKDVIRGTEKSLSERVGATVKDWTKHGGQKHNKEAALEPYYFTSRLPNALSLDDSAAAIIFSRVYNILSDKSTPLPIDDPVCKRLFADKTCHYLDGKFIKAVSDGTTTFPSASQSEIVSDLHTQAGIYNLKIF